MNSLKNEQKGEGFTIIEIVVVVGILGIILAAGLPFGIDIYRNYLLTSEVRNLISIFRRAENLAFANANESAHGVSLQSDKFVLFQGPSYASRTVAFDEEYLRAPSVSISGFSEVVFSAISVKPNATTTITLDNGLRSETININEEGAIFW